MILNRCNSLKNPNIIIIISIIIFAFFLRVSEKEPSSLWTDELATYWVSSAPTISESISRAMITQGQSPLYFILEWIVLQNTPHNEFYLRIISLISSLVSIYILYQITLLFFQDRNKNLTIPNYTPAIFATLLFALDTRQIYYAQEARPYTLAIMFALLSQLYFFKIIKNNDHALNKDKEKLLGYKESLLTKKRVPILLYIIFSALICYTHYIIGTMILIQNIWVLIILLQQYANNNITNKKENEDNYVITLPIWCTIQIIIIILLSPLILHLYPIISESSKWTWLKSGGLLDTFKIFLTLFDIRIIIMFTFILATLYIARYLNFQSLLDFLLKKQSKNNNRTLEEACPKDLQLEKASLSTSKGWSIKPTSENSKLSFLFIWFITPPLFAYFATHLLGSSLLDARYMTLSLIPFYLLAATLINFISDKYIKIFLAAFIIFTYIGLVLIPTYKSENRFSYRIPHNWRSALTLLNSELMKNDVIILRSGFVKENWIPYTNNNIIKNYVKAPLKSFYFDQKVLKKKNISVFNMTYTRDEKFYPYYDAIFDFSKKHKRVWIIGVNPPNTNYKVSQLPAIMQDSHNKIFEKNFSGVYLLLLQKESILKIF